MKLLQNLRNYCIILLEKLFDVKSLLIHNLRNKALICTTHRYIKYKKDNSCG